MKGIVLASHGKLAEGMLDTLKLFVGDVEQLETVCLMASDDTTQFGEKLKAAIDKVNTGDGVVLFCDLLFGTPCNTSAMILADESYRANVEVITGLNLPMILEYTSLRTQGNELNVDSLCNVGKDGIVDYKKKLMESQGK